MLQKLLFSCLVFFAIWVASGTGLFAQTAVVGFSDQARCIVQSCALSEDGGSIAIAGQDSVIRIWDVESGRIVHSVRLYRGSDQLGSLSSWNIQKDFSTLFVATRGNAKSKANLYRCRLGDAVSIEAHIADQSTEYSSLLYLDDKDLLVCATKDGGLTVRNSNTLQKIQQTQFPQKSYITQLAKLGTKGLYALTIDGKIGIWSDCTKPDSVAWKPAHGRQSYAIPLKSKIVSASIDGSICTTDLNGKVLRIRNSNLNQSIVGMCATPDEDRIVVTQRATVEDTSGTKSDTFLFDLKNLKPVRSLTTSPIYQLTHSADRSKIAKVDFSGRVEILDGNKLEKVKQLQFTPHTFGWRVKAFDVGSLENAPIYWTDGFENRQSNSKLNRSFDFFNLKLSELDPRQTNIPIQARVIRARNEVAKQVWTNAGEIPALFQLTEDGKSLHKAFFVAEDEQLGEINNGTWVGDHAYLATSEGLLDFDLRSVSSYTIAKNRKKLQSLLTTHVAVMRNENVSYLVTFDEDFFVKIWDQRTGKHLLSFFPSGDQWVCWTPEGYYACSANAENLMGWHINRNIDELADFRSFEAFHREHHDPKLIQDLWLTGDLDASYVRTRSGGTSGSLKQGNSKAQSQKPVLASKQLSPEVFLEVEMDRVKKENDTYFTRKNEVEITASGKLRSGERITSIEIKKGRQTVYTMPEKDIEKLNGRFEFRTTVALDPGLTELDVRCEASNQMFGRLSTPIRVHRMTSADDQEFRRLFVLSVSVSEFDDPSFPDLQTPKQDADRIVEALDHDMSGLFIESQPKIIRIQPKTKEDFTNALLEIKKDFKSTDVLLIYWSGHGKVVDFQQTPEFVLIMPNCTADSPARLGVRATDLYHELSMFEGGRIVLVLDACHSGAVASFTNQRQLSNNVMSAAREDLRIMTMAACQSSETAEVPPSKDGGSSYFTGAILTGLAGNEQTTSVLGADSDKKTRVVLTELLPEFVRAKVRTETRAAQEPVSAGFSIDDPTPIVKLSR